MKSYIVIEITHQTPQADLAERAAGRVYSMQGIDNAEVVKVGQAELEALVQKGKSAPTPGDIADAARGIC